LPTYTHLPTLAPQIVIKEVIVESNKAQDSTTSIPEATNDGGAVLTLVEGVELIKWKTVDSNPTLPDFGFAQIEGLIANTNDKAASVRISFDIYDKEGHWLRESAKRGEIPAGKQWKFELTAAVKWGKQGEIKLKEFRVR